jgi:16S rRNA (uracil1498-N3)-methyltransferase
MSYFLFPKPLTKSQTVTLDGEEVVHLFSRRVKQGERINLQGSDAKRFACEILKVFKKEVNVKILEEVPVPEEPKIQTALFQSFVNEQALDFILQKSTELGAGKIILFNSQNVAVKLSEDGFRKKFIRWNKILWESAKQCDRVCPPTLEFLIGIEDALKGALNYEKIFLLDPKGENLKPNIYNLKAVGLVVGPEGGFTKEEVEKFKFLSNCESISLGPFFLRAETAALAGLAALRLSGT